MMEACLYGCISMRQQVLAKAITDNYYELFKVIQFQY